MTVPRERGADHRPAGDVPLTGTLDAALTGVWDRIGAMREVALATCGPDGPQARTVVLRRADRAAAAVEMASDSETAKVRALRADPRASVMRWDPVEALQIRLSLTVRIVVGDARRWDAMPEAGRWNYGAVPAPGMPVPAPDAWERPSERSRFAVLIGAVRRIDAVLLAEDGHRRAAWDAADGFAGAWLSP